MLQREQPLKLRPPTRKKGITPPTFIEDQKPNTIHGYEPMVKRIGQNLMGAHDHCLAFDRLVGVGVFWHQYGVPHFLVAPMVDSTCPDEELHVDGWQGVAQDLELLTGQVHSRTKEPRYLIGSSGDEQMRERLLPPHPEDKLPSYCLCLAPREFASQHCVHRVRRYPHRLHCGYNYPRPTPFASYVGGMEIESSHVCLPRTGVHLQDMSQSQVFLNCLFVC